MPIISTADVRPGKCFTAKADGVVRRVQAIRDGSVIFEARSRKSGRNTWSKGSEMPVSEFVAEVDREVGGDFDGGPI